VRYAIADAASYEANKQLARQGDGGSMVRLAKLLLGPGGTDGTVLVDGTFVPAQEAKALWYLHQAAEVGHADAAYFLGRAYSDGSSGLTRDPAKGNHWLRAAEKRGHKRAMFRLGAHYACGVGVRVDPKRAFELFSAAAEEDSDYPLGAWAPPVLAKPSSACIRCTCRHACVHACACPCA
jgi:TPR repeat protein